jgi:glycoside/pentoside/hexuronide:cation symporter, GPH family
VAQLPRHRPPPFRWRDAFAEIFQAFKVPAFLIFAAGAMAAYISQGITFSIAQYANTFVWQFDAAAFQLYPGALLLSALLMFLVVSPLHRRFGKPVTAAGGVLIAFAIGFAPYALFLSGNWPEPGTTASTWLLYAFIVFATAAGVVSMVSASSMIAEIIELFEEQTGRRAEGAFYSGNWLVQKCATGAGIFTTGLIIRASELPADAQPGSVAPEALATMILLYAAASFVLACVAAWFLGRFPITREQHEARVAALDAASRATPDGSTT